MKYCVSFHRDFRYKNEVDEIIITYKNKNAELLKFLDTIPEQQRVIVDACGEDVEITKNIDIFAAAMQKHKNLVIKMSMTQRSMCVDLFEANIPYFFGEFVDKWDTLMSFIKMGVTDVYIVNELGFELENVSKICKENNVLIRTFPNVAQSSSKIDNLDKLKAFFIRPEDVSFYEPYIDVFEFFGPLDRQSVLYEIYTSGKWLGDLNELIIGLGISIGSRTILPMFGEERVNCGKKCYYGQCIICEKIMVIANQFKEAGIEIVKQKEKEGLNDDSESKNVEESNET